MPDLAPAVRLLHGFGLLVFVLSASLGVYTFLFTEPGVSCRGRALWKFGAVIVAASIATVAGTLLRELSRLLGV